MPGCRTLCAPLQRVGLDDPLLLVFQSYRTWSSRQLFDGDDDGCLIATPYFAVIQRSAFRDEGSLFDCVPNDCVPNASVSPHKTSTGGAT
jgi:hypothetical protein